MNLAYENNTTHLFIYTKYQNEELFHQCGFHTIATVPNVMVLMENSCCYLNRYIKSLKAQYKAGKNWRYRDECQPIHIRASLLN